MCRQHAQVRWWAIILALLVAITWGTSGCGPRPPQVEIVVSPSISTLEVGKRLTLSANATGQELKYQWKLTGPGRLFEPTTDAAVVYGATEPGDVVVTVEVTDKKNGQMTTKSYSFVVEPSTEVVERPADTLTPTPTPTATRTNTPTPTPTATPTYTPTPTPMPVPDAVVVDSVNLRSGPGKAYDINGTLSPGQILTVTGRIADATWLQVITDQMQEGWVVNWADLVTLNLPTEQIPIVPTPPLPPACQITEPADGDENLGYENMVRVTCSYVPDSLYVWILVYSHHDSNYYPQPGSIRSGSGDHEGMAYLGRPTEGIGDEFDIIIALADEDASRILQSAARNYIGWPDFPDGVEEKDRITVRRGQGCLITEPTDGDRDLGWDNDVRAQCFGVPTSLYVWVLVYSHYDSRYYPQVGHIGIGSGDHEGKAYLGIEGTGDGKGIGHEYDIIIALANEAANMELQSAATNYIGWPVLPDGVEARDSITVRRGH